MDGACGNGGMSWPSVAKRTSKGPGVRHGSAVPTTDEPTH